MSRRTGIYGGTFDPVHLGHLIAAQDVLEQFQLDEIIFVPCAQSPHKLDRQSAPARHRLQMLKSVLRTHPCFSVSDCEIRRGGPSFAIETVWELRQARPSDDFFWLIGQDQTPTLSTWKDFKHLRLEVSFIVMDRPGSKKYKPLRGLLRLKNPRQIQISSTEVRQRIKEGKEFAHLVPLETARYLHRHGLYK